jgi:dynein heavy chain
MLWTNKVQDCLERS